MSESAERASMHGEESRETGRAKPVSESAERASMHGEECSSGRARELAWGEMYAVR